jgi:hypothetical protein
MMLPIQDKVQKFSTSTSLSELLVILLNQGNTMASQQHRGRGKGVPYRGKNFDPNFKSKRAAAARSVVVTEEQEEPRPQQPKTVSSDTAKFSLPPPAKKTTAPTPMRNESIWSEAIFAKDVVVKENDPRKLFRVSAINYPSWSDQTFQVVSDKVPNINKQITPEMFRYYNTVLYWSRNIELKYASRQVLTEAEQRFRDFYSTTPLSVLDPQYLYLAAMGSTTTLNGETWNVYIPDLPNQAINGHTGYLDGNPVGIANFQFYQDYPAIGVVADACSQLLVGGGQWNPTVVVPQAQANRNLLGYAPAIQPRAEVLNLLHVNDITAQAFPSDIMNTGINIGLVMGISDILRSVTTFKNHLITINTLPTTGSTSQTLIDSITTPPGLNRLYTSAEVIVLGMNKESATSYGLSTAFCFQPLREAIGAAPNLGWYLLNQAPTPGEIAIRNGYRERINHHGLPPRYHVPVFSSLSLNSASRRDQILQSLAKT